MKETDPNEPIEKTIYGCPKCSLDFEKIEDARKHILIPLSSGLMLPIGYTFGKDYKRKFDKKTSNIYVSVGSEQISMKRYKNLMNMHDYVGNQHVACKTLTTHDFVYFFEYYNFSLKENRWNLAGSTFEFSNLIKEGFDIGDMRHYLTLDKDTFDFFKKTRSPEKYRERILTIRSGAQESPSLENSKLVRTLVEND